MLCIKKGLDVFRKLGLMVLVVARFQYSSMLNSSGRSGHYAVLKKNYET